MLAWSLAAFAVSQAAGWGLVAWSQKIDPAATVTSLSTAAMIGMVGYVAARNYLRSARKRWEIEDRDSLTIQISDLKRSIDQERASLHDARNEANARELDARNRHAEAMEENDRLHLNLSRVTDQLATALGRNADLTEQLARLRVNDSLRAERVERVVSKVADTVGKNVADIKSLKSSVPVAPLPATINVNLTTEAKTNPEGDTADAPNPDD